MNTRYKRSITAFTACVVIAAATLSAPAAAEMRIMIRDLDLSTSEGIAALYQRIERGARRVCKGSAAPWDAGRVRTFQRCYASAIEDAVSTIDHPQLTALHLASSTSPVQVGAASK